MANKQIGSDLSGGFADVVWPRPYARAGAGLRRMPTAQVAPPLVERRRLRAADDIERDGCNRGSEPQDISTTRQFRASRRLGRTLVPEYALVPSLDDELIGNFACFLGGCRRTTDRAASETSQNAQAWFSPVTLTPLDVFWPKRANIWRAIAYPIEAQPAKFPMTRGARRAPTPDRDCLQLRPV